ncbi:LOW QUALITY PROTEIN: hypothetical protein NC652_021863 [Populus alba x Populus x berolinensis]|nr:LOW QUALITY PROTEIN: hypothetical protein NC652_021863 [Populus alba x Populus x berolinensis]
MAFPDCIEITLIICHVESEDCFRLFVTMTTEVCRVVVGTRRNRSLPPCFVSSSAELGVFSKLVDFNSFEMSVVRSEGSCVAIRNLSPSTSINRSCAHGSASSGPTAISMTKLVANCSMPITRNMFLFIVLCCNKLVLCRIHHLLKLNFLELGALPFRIADMKCSGVVVKPDDDATCGTPTWIGKGLTCEERFKRLKHRMKVYFDASRPDHQTSFQHLLKKQGGKRSAWEYPFAVAGVNITFMIMQMLDLDALKTRRTFVRSVFLQMLSENEWAFDLLYCVAFVVMDKQWLERNATYMEFNDILKSTRAQVERELLMDDVLRIEDMPSYSLLI